MGGSKSENNPESFQKEIRAVSQAETLAQDLFSKAQQKAHELISEANSNAVSIATTASKQAVAEKDKLIIEKRKETDKAVQKILSQSQVRAEEISKMRLSPQKAAKLAEGL